MIKRKVLKPTYTPGELRKFDKLTHQASLPNSASNSYARNIARLDLDSFVKEHGEAKCKFMFFKLTGRKIR